MLEKPVLADWGPGANHCPSEESGFPREGSGWCDETLLLPRPRLRLQDVREACPSGNGPEEK